MPFILPSADTSSTFETFKRIIKNYQHVIERNPTACCMIGFTAARMIRNVEGDTIDLEDMELWLQSLDDMAEDTNSVSIADSNTDDSERFDHIEKILCMVGNTTRTEHEESIALGDKPDDLFDRCIDQANDS